MAHPDRITFLRPIRSDNRPKTTKNGVASTIAVPTIR